MKRSFALFFVILFVALLITKETYSDSTTWFGKCRITGKPTKHNQVKYAFGSKQRLPGPNQFKDWPDYDSGVIEIDRFRDDAICVCYGSRLSYSGWAAINVTVLRYFRKVDHKLLPLTMLDRNEGWFKNESGEKASIPIEKISRETYKGFHSDPKELSSPKLKERGQVFFCHTLWIVLFSQPCPDLCVLNIPVPIIMWTGNCAAALRKLEKWPAQLLFKKRLDPFP